MAHKVEMFASRGTMRQGLGDQPWHMQAFVSVHLHHHVLCHADGEFVCVEEPLNLFIAKHIHQKRHVLFCAELSSTARVARQSSVLLPIGAMARQ